MHTFYPNTDFIFTDGSEKEVGFSVVFSTTYFFTAELQAVSLALYRIFCSAGTFFFTIFSDSRSALQGI